MLLATIRLETFRDGVEDLWYAKLLEQKLRVQRDNGEWARRARKALAVPTEVARTVADFSTDPSVLYRWRNEMADLIEEAN